MPTEPIQLILAAFEISLLLAGGVLFLWLLLNPAQRARWLGANRLPPWPVTPSEFGIFVFLIPGSGFLLQMTAHVWLKDIIEDAVDRDGLTLLVNGFGFHGGGLGGWLLFCSMRKTWYPDLGAEAPPDPPAAQPLPWSKVLLYAGGTLLVVWPVLSLLSLGWRFLLEKAGLPDEPQEAIAIFSDTQSPLVLAGMLVVACVLAPLCEELLFRAGLYRFCRQRFGRGWALAISGCLFGALHVNLAGFPLLVLLGMGLALVYEGTGSLRVAVVAHGLFNLNTILIVLSGLQDISP